MKRIVPFALAIAAFAMAFTGCQKNGKAKVSVYLTDDPANYSAVNIDIQKVLINVGDQGAENWREVPLQNPGVYNLLDFRNGMDVLLGDIELPAGKITQMRLVLGSNNTVEENGNTYELRTPSAMQSGLKFNINTTLEEGITYKIWIDFDAGRSVVKAGNSGIYNLKPVIRAFTEATSGAIKGVVMPFDANAWVYAIANTNDTIASAKPDATTGGFLMKGIPAGSYKVSINAVSNGFVEQIKDANVSNGAVTDIGTVTLVR